MNSSITWYSMEKSEVVGWQMWINVQEFLFAVQSMHPNETVGNHSNHTEASAPRSRAGYLRSF